VAEPSIPPDLRDALEELELYLEQQPDESLGGHGLIPATRWVLPDVPGLDLDRYREEARLFVLATPIWDRVLLRYEHDVTYWMAQRLLMSEQHEPELDRARALLEAARATIADRAGLLEREGFPRTARSFRDLLDESAGGEPPADLIWRALGLRIAEPWLQDSVDPELGARPYLQQQEPPGHAPE
jgi:hypothetical protein